MWPANFVSQVDRNWERGEVVFTYLGIYGGDHPPWEDATYELLWLDKESLMPAGVSSSSGYFASEG